MRYALAAASAAAFFLASFAALAPSPASASARVGIEPLKIKLTARSLAASVSLSNKGRNATTFQAELFEWSQVNGEDVLTPTRELLVAPPVFKVDAGGRQVIRIGRLKPDVAGAVEKTYRIAITEVPPDGSTGRENAIATALRITLPVLVPPIKAEPMALEWQATRSKGEGISLVLRNNGNTTSKVVRISLLQDGKVIASEPWVGYVLPGAYRTVEWAKALRTATPGQSLELLTELDNRKTLTQPLEVRVVSVVPRQ